MASQAEQASPFRLVEIAAVSPPEVVHFRTAKTLKGQFPEPLIIPPQLEHRQTFIILHGRGSTATKFGPPLLEMATSSGEKLQTAFPYAKIIFLTASRSRATIYKRSYTYQWFDGWHLWDHNNRQELMSAGLHKSCEYIHGVLYQEIEVIGKENVILWGLSQGCATSLITLLTWNGAPFAATIGMCGYLPYANHIEEIAKGHHLGSGDDIFGQAGSENDDPFSHSGDEDDDNDMFGKDRSIKQDLPTQAVRFLRDEIDMEDKAGMVFRTIPVFLGHGTRDEKVTIEKGREARICLDLIGADVQMVEYEGLGHWYSDEMLGDIFNFLRKKLSIDNAKP